MKAFLSVNSLSFVLLLSACGDGKADTADQMAAAADSARMAAAIDLSEHHLPLMLEMPSGTPAPTLLWKDEIGKLAVRAGDRFALEISEAPADRERLKADLERDLLKRNTIVEETPELLIYRSEFPDDTALVFHHFERNLSADGRFFRVEDAREGKPFTLAEIQRMARAVHAKEPI
ncbi:MAG: hypothetical protein KDC01_09045 [Flavobacteriales bacterium]|jgi:hypothetical protein|nr:hypothetical protein [Flavobacteriales bacterium]